MSAAPASRWRAIGLLLLTALLWSTGGLFVKLVHWHPLSIFSARGIIASVVFLIWLRRVVEQAMTGAAATEFRPHAHTLPLFCQGMVRWDYFPLLRSEGEGTV